MHERRFRIDHTIEAETETVRGVLAESGWAETAGDDWDLLWSNHIPAASAYRARRGGWINHLPGIDPLILKDSLHDHLSLSLTAGPDTELAWAFPRSFSLGRDRAQIESLAAQHPELVWIVKPADGSMGRGISLVRQVEDLPDSPGLVIQEYMDQPLVFPDAPAKHVLRVYVLVTSVAPFRAYLHRECTVKVASRPYVPASDDTDLVVHLTNPTIQTRNTDVADPIRAVDMDTYNRRLVSVGHDPEVLWARMHRLVGDVLAVFADPVAVLSSLFAPNPAGCFELLGLDVVVDTQLRPWLLECNLSPSLATRSPRGTVAGDAQRRAKHRVIRDMFALVLSEVSPADSSNGFDPVRLTGRTGGVATP